MTYSIHDATGRCICFGTCQDEDVSKQTVPSGGSIRTGEDASTQLDPVPVSGG